MTDAEPHVLALAHNDAEMMPLAVDLATALGTDGHTAVGVDRHWLRGERARGSNSRPERGQHTALERQRSRPDQRRRRNGRLRVGRDRVVVAQGQVRAGHELGRAE